jgi:hypothetical protein
LLIEVRTYIKESLEKIDRLESKTSSEYFEKKIEEAQQILEEKQELLDLQKAKIYQEDEEVADKKEEVSEVNATENSNGSESFFDQIG